MSDVTRRKVEQLARQSHSRLFDFLKINIGFAAGDAADSLSRSDGGIRFLCFAALILCWGDDFLSAARLLQLQLRQSMGSNITLPTLRQLADLLGALKPKLLCAGVTDEYLGWVQYCGARFPDGSRLLYDEVHRSPGVGDFSPFVDALRRCYRLGDVRERVRIECGPQYVPWLITAMKWMVGYTPSVHFCGVREPILDGDEGVSVTVSESPNPFMVSIVRVVDSLDEVITRSGDENVGYSHSVRIGGFTDLTVWLKWRLQLLGIDSNVDSTLIRVALKVLPERVVMSQSLEQSGALAEAFKLRSLPCAFPSWQHRRGFLNHLLGAVSHPEGSAEIVDVTSLLDSIQSRCPKMCGCVNANSSTDSEQADNEPLAYEGNDSLHGSGECFKLGLGNLIADVIALSLFAHYPLGKTLPRAGYPDYRSWWYGNTEDSSVTIQNEVAASDDWVALVSRTWWRVLRGDVHFLRTQPQQAFLHVANLLDHRIADDRPDGRSFLFSRHGQVVYPEILSTGIAIDAGYLQLQHDFATVLWDQNITSLIQDKYVSSYESRNVCPGICLATGRTPKAPGQEIQTVPADDKIYRPEQSQTDFPVTFRLVLSAKSFKTLSCSVSHQLLPWNDSEMIFAWDLVVAAAQAFRSLQCKHLSQAEVNFSKHDFRLWNREDCGVGLVDRIALGEKVIAPLHKSPSAQWIQLALLDEYCMLHRDGCLECTLKLANKIGVSVVVC